MRARPDACVWCGYALDAHEVIHNPAIEPKPGDVTICIQCAGPMLFGPALRFAKPTLVEL